MSSSLKDKNVTLCVTGGIACYKAVYLASFLKKKGANVHVILSENAKQFVTPITFKSITRNPVITEMFDPSGFIPHISISDLTDILIVAPATANCIAKAACGIADDMISTVIVSSKAPKVIIPAMNTGMYENPITQRNISTLKEFGFYIMEPDEGELACGTSGKGRFPEIERIYGFLIKSLANKNTMYAGKKVVVTAGGTVEDIDPVRYISNRSSGKTAFAFAEALIEQGADVSILHAHVSENALTEYTRKYGTDHVISCKTAKDMKMLVEREMKEADILVMCAAVADYAPVYSEHKVKKSNEALTLELTRTPDILGSLPKQDGKLYIGFAAETDDLALYADKKLKNKGLDFVIANEVSGAKAAIGGAESELHLYSKWTDEAQLVPYGAKETNAPLVLSMIAEILNKVHFRFGQADK